jgi:hypothetical protein
LILIDHHNNGVLLNPYFIEDLGLRDDQDVMAGLMRMFYKFFDTNKDYQAVKVEFNQNFHTLLPWKTMSLLPIQLLFFITAPY